jgi:hypothetical protein
LSEAKPRFTRWIIPAGIIWGSLLMSAWVYSTQLAEGAPKDPLLLGVILVAAPLVGTVLLVTVLLATKRVEGGADATESTDLVVIWMLTFLFMLHAATMAVLIGLLDGLVKPAAAATGVMFVGLGFLLRGLEHKSPVGVRTERTMADPEAWARAHRSLSLGLFVAGILAGVGSLLAEPLWVAGAVGVSALALLFGAASAKAPAAVNVEAPGPVEQEKAPSEEEAP